MNEDARLLQDALALARRGDHPAAFSLLAPLADRRTDDVNIQMQAAMIARMVGQFEKALGYLATAARLAPNDPQILNIEANTIAAAGRGEEAVKAFNDLVAKFPEFVDGHINRALTAQEMGRDDLALDLVEKSLAKFPNQGRLLAIRGAILKNLGRLDEALATLDRAVTAEPRRARTHFSRGVTLRAMERNHEAEEAFLTAGRLGMEGHALKSALAAVELELDKVDEAEAHYFEAFAAGDPEAGAALARLRREYRGADDAFGHYAQRAEALPDVAAGWYEWLACLLEYEEYGRLREVAGQALSRHPDDQAIRAWQAIAMGWTGERGRAISTLRDLLSRDPGNMMLHEALAEAALIHGDLSLAEAHAQAATRIDPLQQGGWSYLATAWRLMGDEREFWLCDYDRMVMPTEVVPVDGVGDSAAYAERISAILDTLHRTSREPGNQSLRGGTQTSGALFDRPIPEIASFRDAVLQAVQAAVAQLPDDPDHPFLSRKSPDLRFAGSWSVRLASGQGHHVSHFHGKGWISSAYYARVPELPALGEGTEGYIQFGAPPEKWGLDLQPRRIVRPEPGRLVLFPSYMWHGTMPFACPGTRMTSAFDIVPA